MPTASGRIRAVLAAAALVVALAAFQGVAAGATITRATIEGTTSTSSPSASVLPASVTVDLLPGEVWRSTGVTFTDGGETVTRCINTADQSGGEAGRTVTQSFNLTAPTTPGSYNIAFTAFGGVACTQALSPPFVLDDGLRVTQPAPNPNLPPRCGIDVMLVLDESTSIATSGQTQNVRNATRAFLTALSGTGAAVSIVDFSTNAARPVPYTTVTADTIAKVFNPYLVNGYNPSGWTNWEAAFAEVRQANTQGTLADLVVFMTDGDPTAHSNPSGPSTTGLPEGDVRAMRPAVHQADLVKGQGSHVFALGVGAAVTTEASAGRLAAISGFDQFPPADFSEADYTLVQDFDQLAQALRQIAIELCQASVSVTKLVDEGDGVYRSDPGWTFTATLTVPGGYRWLQPAPPPATGPRSDTTNKDGVVTFQWKPTDPQATSTVALSEQPKPGYDFVDATCTWNAPGRTRLRSSRSTTVDVATITLRPNEYAKCLVRNKIRPGTIEIEKSANPQGSKQFAFTGSAGIGNFTLVDDTRDDAASAKTFTGLAPGSYTVRETVPEDWELTGVVCSDPAVVIAGPQVTINLAPGGSVVCTYRDTRIDPPVPPEPPDPPPDPLTPPGPGPPEPPTPAPSPPTTQIRLLKTAPAVARVGQRVAFELTVRNVGPVAAQNVIVADVPPAALTLAGLQSSGGARVRLARGNAYWHLGTMAPGARRTIRGTVLIKGGTAGLKRNLAVATAVNANLARDNSDTRVLAQVQRRVVPVTG